MGAVLKLIAEPDKCRQDAIEAIAEVRKELDSGEAISVYGIVENKDGTYRHFGSSTMSRLQTAGALLECAIARLDK